MGLLIEGHWHNQWYDTKHSNGEFIREDSQFRNWITPDGSAGLSGTAQQKMDVIIFMCHLPVRGHTAH